MTLVVIKVRQTLNNRSTPPSAQSSLLQPSLPVYCLSVKQNKRYLKTRLCDENHSITLYIHPRINPTTFHQRPRELYWSTQTSTACRLDHQARPQPFPLASVYLQIFQLIFVNYLIILQLFRHALKSFHPSQSSRGVTMILNYSRVMIFNSDRLS